MSLKRLSFLVRTAFARVSCGQISVPISFALVFLAFTPAHSYDYIDEALKNGHSSGDAFVLYDFKRIHSGAPVLVAPNNPYSRMYVGDANYLLSNIRLGYLSGFYKFLRLKVDFASSFPFYGTRIFYGSKNASYRAYLSEFYNLNSATFGESFLEYFDGDTNVRIGRIDPKDEMHYGLSDGALIRNRSFKNLLLEAQILRDYGRIGKFAMSDFVPARIYKVAAQYYFFDGAIKLKSTLGAQDSSFFLGSFAEFSASIEPLDFKVNVGDVGLFSLSHIFYMTGIMKYKGFSLGLGTLGTGSGALESLSSAGFGFLNRMSSQRIFFMPALYTKRSVRSVFGFVGGSLRDFAFSLGYATSSFGVPGNRERQNEFAINSETYLTNNVSLLLSFSNAHIMSSLPTYSNFKAGVSFRF